MQSDPFETLVREAVKEIPKDFLAKIKNVEIIIEDNPTGEQYKKLLKRGEHGLLLGLYEGIPQTKRKYYGIGGNLPDKITIFRIPILSIARSPLEIKNIVEDTVIHEIAHHFGIDDATIHSLKKKNNQLLP